ncbi:ABC transporter substrate-binding protein [Neopusillimonas aromaticivorans]|uniref:ABC transporter substrate-binding protein n=1 Tax=Neopusillimonas aromaticivorans TaxID=2979868 RepID=UPI002596923D|nr:ABC transporter substrate-binding protein [Neopusillimonas aromaticivorans]WJJ95002.1 ABC transporter substrate-binding protein [Neopusillimonas aromaticivorans]
MTPHRLIKVKIPCRSLLVPTLKTSRSPSWQEGLTTLATCAGTGSNFYVCQRRPKHSSGQTGRTGSGWHRCHAPILAKADGLSVAVFGMSGPRHENGGLCVRSESGIRSLHDLKGRNIALMPISWHTQFLAAELHATGLGWSDVNAVDLLPATAKDAFEAGLLDAIVATDPLFAQIQAKVSISVLAKPGHAFSNRSVYWARHDTLQKHPDAVEALFDAIRKSDEETAADPSGAAKLLDGLNGVPTNQWLDVLKARPWGIDAPTQEFLDEQQAHADIFAQFGLIPSALDMRDTVTNRFGQTSDAAQAA